MLPLKKPNETRPDHPETGDSQAKRVRHLLLAPPRGELDFERSVPNRGWKSRTNYQLPRIVRPLTSSSSFAPCARRSARLAQACARIQAAPPPLAGVALRPRARALRASAAPGGRPPRRRGGRGREALVWVWAWGARHPAPFA